MKFLIVFAILIIPLILIALVRVFTITTIAIVEPIDDALGIIIDSFFKAMDL